MVVGELFQVVVVEIPDAFKCSVVKQWQILNSANKIIGELKRKQKHLDDPENSITLLLLINCSPIYEEEEEHQNDLHIRNWKKTSSIRTDTQYVFGADPKLVQFMFVWGVYISLLF